MTNKLDNRMAWIRNIEKLTEFSEGSYYAGFEIASECYIAGLLNYEEGKIRCCMFSMDKDDQGLYHYLLEIKYPKFSDNYNKAANKKGYYFKDGEIGELVALFSLYFQCRFYLIATYAWQKSGSGTNMKFENKFLYKKITNKSIHPNIFNEIKRSFNNGLAEFLDLIKKIDVEKHQKIIISCDHYNRSLKEVGIDGEMVFIRLVSAIETLSQNYVLTKYDNPLNGINFSNLFKISKKLSDGQEKQLKEILKVDKDDKIQIEKSKQKFIKFIIDFSKGYFKGGYYKAKHCKITKNQLPNILKIIYDARSAYLHSGSLMYLSQPMNGSEKWDTDPTVGMTIDNKFFSKSQKLPYAYFFEGLVRQCLLNFIKDEAIY